MAIKGAMAATNDGGDGGEGRWTEFDRFWRMTIESEMAAGMVVVGQMAGEHTLIYVVKDGDRRRHGSRDDGDGYDVRCKWQVNKSHGMGVGIERWWWWWSVDGADGNGIIVTSQIYVLITQVDE